MKAFEYRTRVYFSDTDAGGIAYHANYLNWAEHGRTEMLRAIYPGRTQMQLAEEEHLLMVVRSISIEYRKPAYLEDEITVLTEMEEVQHFSFTMKQRIMRSDDLLAELSIRIAVIDSATKKPRRIPEDILRAFEA